MAHLSLSKSRFQDIFIYTFFDHFAEFHARSVNKAQNTVTVSAAEG